MRTSINISLPPALKDWVEAQVAAGGYGTTSEFFRQLLRAEKQRQLREQIDENLHSALDGGEATSMSKKDWEGIRREGRKRIAAKKRNQQ